jgi:hypothetical protein
MRPCFAATGYGLRLGMRIANPVCVASSAVLLLLACGGEPEPVAEPQPEPSSGDEAVEANDGVGVTGLMGTIPASRIQLVLEAKLPTFQRCFMNGMEQVEFLGGHIKFYFRVGPEGRVEWVDPRGSSIGHRATEQCLLEEAARTRFPSPKGGDAAEFVWGFELDAAGGVRAPVAWDAERAASAVTAGTESLVACGVDGHRYAITAYVAKGGAVMGAGAAADSHEAAASIDCILEAVAGWKFADPGSYPAKVSFTLP